ncbi:DNA-binding response regulator, NarL/FixJ family, contains REC and HTH domains [Amycolatopsis sacchari]|uniref:DNA-binding response regulator, NarL/FixJ family, contains REC and HTH domains n=1 Tax=Amycolatopsis sacchari TaxID=115433 RepID=A0A1I3PY18_9PSEU|nr:response regulator transcription factor [Amycolatopsis sacchari]SFJ26568.1 DNA-binding response regulator, NarL/FixJ family, contains REC and HTH domains [Amycolatopsis sacchari]
MTPHDRPRRVVVVDLDPIYRAGLAWIVDNAPDLEWAGHTATVRGAAQLVAQARPDLVLLDSRVDQQGRLPRLLGGADRVPAVLVVVAERHDEPEYITGALDAGARGVVPRSAGAWHLLECVRAACAGRPVQRPRVVSTGVLSPREAQVLDLLAEGLGNAAIADVLRLSVETIRTHVRSILRKLRARDRTHAVAIGFRNGLLVPPAGEPVLPRQERGVVSVE